ncbi:hypothetical protein MJD09_12345, partial [bacterium]|nr:hypothetical protein [bacterium]
MPHYQWASNDNNEGNVSWYGAWNDLYFQKSTIENDSWYVDGTIYAFFERTATEISITYFMHFPFNASANRHEGDLPGILVKLHSQNPSSASITSVRYPFHAESTLRTIPVSYSTSAAEALYDEEFIEDGNGNPTFANKYFVIDGTHPVTFGGGKISELGHFGWGSHAQYPSPGKWIRENLWGLANIDELVVENGSISSETLSFDFNNYQN